MTAAPDLSPAERAIVDRFDAAPDLPESWAGQQRMAAGYAQARDRLADQERQGDAWNWGGTDLTPRP